MSTVGRYGGFELYEKIGAGGMATVYRGVQTSLDRRVVLKILHPHLSGDDSLVVRFEREARAAANLRHENIVQVIDCGREEGTSYIAMEFVAGMDLKRFTDLHGAPPVEMALLILRDVARGLEHAHLHRVVHRDIKPANLMLTPDGTVKIMDFGLARRGEDSVGMTATGAVLGTPAYMSPEQAAGKHVDERSDIFSLGVVGYELLGGRRPFPGDSYVSVINAIMTLEPESLRLLNPGVPSDAEALIRSLLEKDPERRCPTVARAREELETIVERLGLVRGKDLLRRYAADPVRVTGVLLSGGPAAVLATRPPAAAPEPDLLDTVTRPLPAGPAIAPPVSPSPPLASSAPPPALSGPPPGLSGSPPASSRPPLPPVAAAPRGNRLPVLAVVAGAALVVVLAAIFAGPHFFHQSVEKTSGGTTTKTATGGGAAEKTTGGTATKTATGGGASEKTTGGTVTKTATGGGAAEKKTGSTATKTAIGGTAGEKHPPGGHRYRIGTRPSFAYIYLDGSDAPLNPDGRFPTLTLSAGRHKLRAVNKDLDPPVDITFEYVVAPGDQNNTLILNLATGEVHPRANRMLPF